MDISQIVEYGIDEKEVNFYLDKLKYNESIIAVTGEFSSGKTCFINALINKEDFLPHQVAECTPVIIDLIKSEETDIVIKYKDGSEKREPNIKENIYKYATYNKEYDTEIISISIPVTSEYLKDNIHIMDTPGTNTIIKEHEEITNYILKKADAVIYVLNKVISETDINHIKNIYKYTKDIIFVLTHIDELEASETESVKEQIQRLMNLVIEDINKKIGIDKNDIMIYPVGSKEAFHDPTYINEIRDYIDIYIENNSKDEIRKRVKSQLSVVFEEKLANMNLEKDFLYKNINSSKNDIQDKIISFEKKLNRIEEKYSKIIKRIDEKYLEEEKNISSYLTRIFEEEKGKLKYKILNEKEVTTEIVENEFENAKLNIGKNINNKIRETIELILSNEYSNLNEDLNYIIKEIDVSLNANIRQPNIEEIDNYTLERQMNQIKSRYEECILEIEELKNDIELNYQEKEEKDKLIEQLNEAISINKKELDILGEYIPEYERVINKSAAESGAKVGRVIGEVADIALIFWNPGSTANVAGKGAKLAKTAKTLDTAKDATKLASYFQKGVKSTTTVVKNTAASAQTALVKTVSKASNLKKKTDVLAQEVGAVSSNNMSIGKALDMLSIGYWGEKVGAGIGEIIKPSETLMIENKEKKAEWQKNRNIIVADINNHKDDLRRIERQIEDSKGEINKKIRLKKEYESKRRKYEDLMKELEEKYNIEKEINIKNQIINYYDNEINLVFERESKKAIETSLLMFNSSKENVKLKIIEDLDNKTYDLKSSLEELLSEKDNINKVIQLKENQIEELRKYEEWIEDWVG